MNYISFKSSIRGAAIFFGIFAGGCGTANYKAPADIKKPNIIYILADDLGYGDLGSYGQKNIKTPNLDRLAGEGMRFTQHYSGSTVCAPSRAVLMTGLHSGHAPIRGNKEIMPIGQYPLQYGTVTFPMILQKAGYTTGAFGKWGLGPPDSEGSPSLQGFDRFFGLLCQRRSHFFYPEFLFNVEPGRPAERVYLEGNKTEDASTENFQRPGSGPPIERGQYSTDVMTREALEFIDQNSNRPFFLYIPTQIPHASLTVPDDVLELYLDENGESIFEEDTSFPFGAYTWQSKPKATYAAMVTRLDQYVGMILDKLEEKDIAENTLVIFTSDNGSYTEGGYHYSMHNSNAPLRGGKRDLYEGGIRVPAIAWWPGKIRAGSVSDHISGFQDMMPTFAELAGANTPPQIDGISMVPELLGRTNEQEKHEYLYWEFHSMGGRQAVRMDKWKGVRLNVSQNRNAPIELYNLEEDIGERNDLAAQHPEIVEKIDRIMREAHVPSELFPFFDKN
ncbi:MAG: arylsulfatase [Bacteroidales bacterium]|nr:arylsulfatase [Bacteroidales bacterium]